MALKARMEDAGINTNSFGDGMTPQAIAALSKGDPSLAFSSFVKDNPIFNNFDVVNINHVKPIIKRNVESISNDFKRLRNILGSYEPILQKRWLKKTKEQRTRLLLSAWPNMAQHHRSDLRFLWQERDRAKWRDPQHYDKFMYPDVNIEDLTKPKPLLLMLESRSRHTPATFANHDWNNKELGLQCQIIRPAVTAGWIMLLRDDAYGSLHPHNRESWYTLKTGLSFVPGIGMFILETQQRLMRFLVTCSELILHDLALDANLLPQVQHLPPVAAAAATAHSDDVDLRPSLDTVVQEAPYRTPQQFDFARLQNFVYAKRAEAEDHLWALREDPSYFTETMQALGEHKDEVVRGKENLPNSWSAPRIPTFWEEIIRCMIHTAYTEVMHSADLYFRVSTIVDIREKHGARIKRTEALPKDYLTAIALLEVQVQEQISGHGISLTQAVRASGQLGRHFVVKPNLPGEDPRMFRVAATNIPRNDYFLWVIAQLVDPLAGLSGNAGLLYELQRMMQADPKQKQRLTAWVARVISALSIAFELKRQIHLLSPGPNGPNVIELPCPQSVLDDDSKRRNELVDRIQDILMEGKDKGAFAKSCLPLSKFHHPSDKRQTAITTEQMREAETYLDQFWLGVDQYFVRKTGKTLNHLVEEKMTHRALNRTAPWTESQAVADTEQGKGKGKDTNGVTVPVFDATHEERRARTVSLENIPPTKLKTRGTPTKAVENINAQREPPSTETENEVRPLFRLDKRAYKVFSSIFRLSTKDGVPGEIPWTDFVHAMVSIGFAVQSLDGSASIFSPADGSLGRSIIFHEPHPMSKIPYLVAKRVGRRLNRAFGWRAENFVRE